MNIEYRCPACQQCCREQLVAGATSIQCPACQSSLPVMTDRMTEGRLSGCLLCPGRELFQRKDFPQRLGVAIVALGFAASCVTWYWHRVTMTFAILFLTAMVDLVLYLVVGNVLECYNCHTIYRSEDVAAGWERFHLETHERFRQQQARRAAVKTVKVSGNGEGNFQAGGS